MATQTYMINMQCEAFGERGYGAASDNDNGPDFSVDSMPVGFKHTYYSPNP